MVSVVMAGGATTGHITPLVATAERLLGSTRTSRITCIGTRGLGVAVIPAAGLTLELVPPVPLPRKPSVDLLNVPTRLASAVSKAVLHSQGRGRRRGRRLRRLRVAAGLPGCAPAESPSSSTSRTHWPVWPTRSPPGSRRSWPPRSHTQGPPRAAGPGGIAILDPGRPPPARALGLRAEGPTLLVSGGSQGAVAISTAVDGARDRLLAAASTCCVVGPKNMTDDLVAASPTRRQVHSTFRSATSTRWSRRTPPRRRLMVGRSGAGHGDGDRPGRGCRWFVPLRTATANRRATPSSSSADVPEF